MTTEIQGINFLPVGDAALLVTFGARIDLKTNRQVHALAQRLLLQPLAGVVETVPSYASLLVHYDPLQVDYPAVLAWASANAETTPETFAMTAAVQPRCIEIPTLYGGEHGPDLDFVAAYHHLTPAEVIRIHCGVDYPVFMLGFTPGFAYLGGLDPAIATPRLDKPRPRILAGSVGIAGEQTGVYSLDTPGGWRIIGWTPLRLFDPLADPPSLLAPGDLVRFLPITEAEVPRGAARR